jgi:hypothetical protein
VSVEAARRATGWPLQVGASLEQLPPPPAEDLKVLREMQAATERAHSTPVRIRLPGATTS